MFNKKYKLVKAGRKTGEQPYPADLDNSMQGCTCYLAYFNPGETGWFLCWVDSEPYGVPHRIQTSKIQEVKEEADTVTVRTENTIYVFEPIN